MKISTITAIFLPLLELVRGSSELCESFAEKRYITKEEAEQEVGPWFQTQFEEWESSHKATEPEFWTWFHQKYSPGTTESILSCKLSGTCSRYALFSLESVANFHNTMWMIKEANVEAWNTVEGSMQSLISQFSDGKNVEAMKARHERHLKLLMHSIIAVTVVVTAILAVAGSVLALGTAISGAISSTGIIAEDKLVVAMTNLKGATIRTASSVGGLLGSVESGAVALHGDTLKGPDYASKIEIAAREANSQNFQLTSKFFDANMLSILSGNESLVQNSTLAEIVTSGQFANTTEILASYRDELKNMWTASAISSIWSMEHSYIVASDVSSGGCKSDHRGPQILKSCLDEYPTKVFYTYFKSNCREGIKGYPLIRGPPGHEFLKKATNFTLDDVVRSSMTHLKDHGNKTPKPPVGLEGFGSLYGPDTAITHGGGRARGLFTIPVCYTPGGQAISSINRRRSRNYPCACSKFTFSGKHHKARDLDHTELQARSLRTRDADDGGSWPNDHSSTYNFFLSSGIGQSKKFRNYCKHYRGARNTRGNGCHRKNKIDWHWPNGRDGPKHPFHKCKSNPHKVVGFQQPNNDGWKQNKDCGKGKALGFDALVVDYSLEPASAVGGVNATWRNSSYATELPDYDDANDVDDAEDSEEEFDDLDDEVDSGLDDDDEEDYQVDEHVGESEI
ncbi:hypothetical protein E4T49_00779 [Aureobasidium sp. EXF-10728]|nr:hypothetical protein E4T49_00779 [Aureobasidium sp. EXF-10728]